MLMFNVLGQSHHFSVIFLFYQDRNPRAWRVQPLSAALILWNTGHV